jgi:hypothetical protein
MVWDLACPVKAGHRKALQSLVRGQDPRQPSVMEDGGAAVVCRVESNGQEMRRLKQLFQPIRSKR